MLVPSEMPARLEKFLSAHLPQARQVEVDSYEPVFGGYTRLTAKFRATIDGEPRWMIVRGDPPPEKSVADTDRGVEFRTLSALHRTGTVPVAEVLFLDPDGSALGTEAIVMELIEGEPLLRRVIAADDAQRGVLSDGLIDLAAAVHTADTTNLADLPRPKDWDAYIDSIVATWRQVEAAHVESDPFIRYLASWLDKNRPPPAPLGLVHGDFQSTNVMVEESGRQVAIDWELTHIGDPREDLGWLKWNEIIQPPGLMNRDEAAFCRRYAEVSGLGEDIVNPATLGYFSVLSAIDGCRLAFPAVAAYAERKNSGMQSAYVLGYISTFHEQFVEVTEAVDAMTGRTGSTGSKGNAR